MLAEGPRTIHAKGAVGYKYLESMLGLFWHCKSFATFRSCRIYCDACGDDDAGFLPPLVRIAEWERRKDLLELKPSWPNVNITLLELSLDCPQVEQAVCRVQELIDSKCLTSFGLSTRRKFGEIEFDDLGHLRIEAEAGWQTVARAFWLSEAGDCSDIFDTMTSVVQEHGSVSSSRRWIERYDKSPTSAPWEWDYVMRKLHA